MRRVAYAVLTAILAAIAAFLCALPAYQAIGELGGGSQSGSVSISARPAFSLPPGVGVGAVCGPGEECTIGKITPEGLVTQSFAIESFDKRFRLTLDEGTVALSRDGAFFKCIGILKLTGSPSPPQGAHVIGVMYDVVPDGATFTPAATLEYSYDQDDIPQGVAEGSLVIAYNDGATDEWTALDSVVDTEANTIRAKVSRFNDLAVLGYEAGVPAPPAVPPPAKPLNWWLMGGIIAGVGVTAFVIFLFRRRLLASLH